MKIDWGRNEEESSVLLRIMEWFMLNRPRMAGDWLQNELEGLVLKLIHLRFGEQPFVITDIPKKLNNAELELFNFIVQWTDKYGKRIEDDKHQGKN